jgi:REP element-mobilizing transposase RayT
MRTPRKILPGAQYHIVARANRKEFIFTTPAIKELFLSTVKRAKKKYRFSVVSLCIMNNHIHLILCPAPGEDLSRLMQWMLSVFAVRYNKAFSLSGHLWHDRFGSKIIHNLRQFLVTFLYIAENPVRAGLAARPQNYRYNGVRFFKDGRFDILDPPGLLLRLLCPQFPGPLMLPER